MCVCLFPLLGGLNSFQHCLKGDWSIHEQPLAPLLLVIELPALGWV